jgi:negative regulator of sigma-B (phosphoserine phosphatase)
MQLLVGSAQRPVAGETVCGDAFVVVSCEVGTLVCLADGLGHGPAARVASDAACLYVEEHPELPLEAMIRGIDQTLRGTRGAAVSIVSFSACRLQFVGVGNVELRAVSREPIQPPTTPGIVGQGMRKVRVWEYPIVEGDLFVLMSDGISTRFDLHELAHLAAQPLADTLLARHHKSHDDACCAVVRTVAARIT